MNLSNFVTSKMLPVKINFIIKIFLTSLLKKVRKKDFYLEVCIISNIIIRFFSSA